MCSGSLSYLQQMPPFFCVQEIQSLACLIALRPFYCIIKNIWCLRTDLNCHSIRGFYLNIMCSTQGLPHLKHWYSQLQSIDTHSASLNFDPQLLETRPLKGGAWLSRNRERHVQVVINASIWLAYLQKQSNKYLMHEEIRDYIELTSKCFVIQISSIFLL